MRDRWEYIRERDRLFNLEARTYGHKSKLSFQEFHTLVDRRNLLSDADALLAVSIAARKAIPFSSSEATSIEEGGKRMGVLIEALKALPENLK